MSFSSLGLSEAFARTVEAAGYNQPTPMQQQAIPAVLQGRDLMVATQTGTGKAGGFALPVLERLFPADHPDRGHHHGPRQTRVLILTPTRELTAQVHDSSKVYTRDLPLNDTCIFDRVGINLQVQVLVKGVDVLAACPGRLLDLARQNKVDLSHAEILALDEADRMLDMDFIHGVEKVLAKLPPKHQNLPFSATFSKDIADLADKLLYNPEHIEVAPPNTTAERIEQRVFHLPAPRKRALLAYLAIAGAWEQVLISTRTKHGANHLTEYLTKHGLPAAAIHGNKSQSAWTKALVDFKANDVRVLAAIDIAARGLDIDQLPHVISYELPNIEEDYIHRIGRTDQTGHSGEAISLVAPDKEKPLKTIEKMTRQRTSDGDAQGFNPEAVLPEVIQPESREAPQKQPRRDRKRRSSRKRKPKDAQVSNPDGNIAATRDSIEGPTGRRRRREDKNKENREAGQAQQLRRSHEAHPTRPDQPPEVDDNRDPEEFLGGDFDNFGNRADYVSPYQGQGNKGRERRGGQQKPRGGTSQQGRGQDQGQARGKSQGTAQGGARGQGAGQGKAEKPRASKSHGQSRENASRMNDAPLREPSKYDTDKQPNRQSVVINKCDLVHMDHFPTAEQLDELEPRHKDERPALLTRNH